MITENQRFQFQQQGYVVLEKILSESVLGWLQTARITMLALLTFGTMTAPLLILNARPSLGSSWHWI